jgi:LacI family transcriptional regulator
VSRADARLAKRLPFPVVNLASHLSDIGVPSVVVDHAGVGDIAARHLISRGFKRFGFFGAAGFWYSELRGESFKRTVEASGGTCDRLESMPGLPAQRWRNEQRRLERWLANFRKPVAIMGSNDLRAGMVLEACRRLQLRVPEDVSVIGVDNEPVFAEFDDPPLTSVSRNDYEVGRKAAEMLQALMQGRSIKQTTVFVPPEGVVPRKSTDTVAIEDELVANVVRYIHAHVHEPFGVNDILAQLPHSRRSLEYHFRQSLDCTPYDYIIKLRLDRAKQFLADEPRMKLAAISAACGFTTPRQFRLVFRRMVGTTPAHYRQMNTRDAVGSVLQKGTRRTARLW